MIFRYFAGAGICRSGGGSTQKAGYLPSREQIDDALSGLGSNNQFDRSKTIDWGYCRAVLYPELELGVGVALVGMYQADSDPDS